MADINYCDNSLVFTDEQLNISNWTKNMSSFPQFDNVYNHGVNTLTYRGGNGYERIYTKITVEKNKDYTINIRFNSPTGFNFGGYSGVNKEQFFVMNREPSGSSGTHYTALSGVIAYSENLDNSASDVAKDYTISFNSGNYTELYVVIDFGQITDGYTRQFVYEIPVNRFTSKYLIYDDILDKYYNITNNQLTELSITELTANNFKAYGNDDVPDGMLLIALQKPRVYYWQDSNDELPTISVNVTATPQPQVIITDKIYLTDKSITGIESALATCEGDLIVAVSFDDKQTWKAWNGEQWATLSDDNTGMSKETLEGITFEQWNGLYAGATGFYVRVSLLDTTQSVEKIVFDFSN